MKENLGEDEDAGEETEGAGEGDWVVNAWMSLEVVLAFEEVGYLEPLEA